MEELRAVRWKIKVKALRCQVVAKALVALLAKQITHRPIAVREDPPPSAARNTGCDAARGSPPPARTPPASLCQSTRMKILPGRILHPRWTRREQRRLALPHTRLR